MPAGYKIPAHIFTFSIISFPCIVGAAYYYNFKEDDRQMRSKLRENFPAEVKIATQNRASTIKFFEKMQTGEIDTEMNQVLKGGKSTAKNARRNFLGSGPDVGPDSESVEVEGAVGDGKTAVGAKKKKATDQEVPLPTPPKDSWLPTVALSSLPFASSIGISPPAQETKKSSKIKPKQIRRQLTAARVKNTASDASKEEADKMRSMYGTAAVVGTGVGIGVVAIGVGVLSLMKPKQ